MLDNDILNRYDYSHYVIVQFSDRIILMSKSLINDTDRHFLNGYSDLQIIKLFQNELNTMPYLHKNVILKMKNFIRL